eukprot:TCALIF_10043-PA protein Name:"Protein of unknown function" AED:0.07 eAED:0.08 QI:510/0.84/0.78/0.92/0.84/0.85/14/4508/8
MMEFTNRR